MSNLKQIKFLAHVAWRAGYRTGGRGDVGTMLFTDRTLFERAAAHWRKRHPF